MSRTISSSERAAVGALRSAHFIRIQIWDSTSTYLDYSTQLRNKDWVTSVSVSDNIDANAMSIAAALLRETQGISLAPFMAASVLNQVGGSYATLLDLWRKIKVSFAVMPQGYAPTGADWKDISEGRVDTIDTGGEQISITGRSEEAILLDKWMDTERTYGSVGGIAMETVLQSMLDDNGTGVTLYCPVSPGYLMNVWTQPKGNLFPAMVAVAEKAGFKLRYRYDSAGTFRLTLFQPNRTATVADWTLGPSEYTAVPLNKIDLSGVRNFIKTRFIDATLGIQTVIYPHMVGTGTVTCVAGAATFSSSQAGVLQNGANVIIAGIAYTVSAFSGTTTCTLLSQLATGGVPTFGASAFTAHGTLSGAGLTTSLTRFGRRDMEIDLSFTSQVNTGTKAQGMTDAVGPDMEFPNLEQQFEAGALWFVQLHDYGRFLANGIHYDSDQLGGVTGISFEASQGRIKSTLDARGKPSGAYVTWRNLSQRTVAQTAFPPLDRRTPYLNDGQFAGRSTTNDGLTAHGSTVDSRGFVLNKHFNTDHHILDDVPEGTAYKRVTVNAVDGSSKIDFSKTGFSNKNQDNVSDGATYARALATRISSGKPLIDFSEGIHLNKTIDNVSDGATRKAVTSIDGAGKALIDFSQAGHTNKTLDNVSDGGTYKRVVSVDGTGKVTSPSIAAAAVLTAAIADDNVTKEKVESRNRCLAYASAAQSISSASFTALTFNNESFDEGALHDQVTNTSRVTVPSNGVRGGSELRAQVSFAANATGVRQIEIRDKIGTVIAADRRLSAGAGIDTTCYASTYVNTPASGDWYEVYAYQNSGGALNVQAGAGVTFFAALHSW